MSNNKSHISEKAHRYEEMTRKHGDPWIWGIYIMLIVISLVETYSAASREVVKMGVYMPILKHILFLMIGGGLLPPIAFPTPIKNTSFSTPWGSPQFQFCC